MNTSSAWSSSALNHLDTRTAVFADIILEVHEVTCSNVCCADWGVAASTVVCRVEVCTVKVGFVKLCIDFIVYSTQPRQPRYDGQSSQSSRNTHQVAAALRDEVCHNFLIDDCKITWAEDSLVVGIF